MRDKWMNIGYEDDDLKPYIEPSADNSDHIRIGNNRVGAFLCHFFTYSHMKSTFWGKGAF